MLTTFVLLGCSTTPDAPAQVATPDIEATVVAKVEVEPTPGSPATPHVEPTVTPVAASSEGNRLVISFSPETEARYRVKEQLARLNLPNDAVGVTNAVTGVVTFDVEGKVVPKDSKITIDASALKSDEDRRDNRVRKDILQTNQFPTIDFVIKKTPGLTWPLLGSGEGLFELVGDLTIRDVTKEVTWSVGATFISDRIRGLAETSFTFDDFEISKPTGMFILSVEDLIRLELAFVATYPSGTDPGAFRDSER
jgi:polyisoprenoid-binding protein YceI